jgi:hypothetical protein
MNLSEDLSIDKELFSGVYEGKYISINIVFSYIIIPVYNEFIGGFIRR